MQVDQNTVVTLDYILKDDQGNVMQSSDLDAPIEFIVGHGMVLSGLEDAVLGRHEGEKLDVVLPPEQAYGFTTREKCKCCRRIILVMRPSRWGISFKLIPGQ